jgi:8-oxo-dGTP diphosphatase
MGGALTRLWPDHPRAMFQRSGKLVRMRIILDWAHRVAYAAGFRLALIYWHLRRPEHQGALVAVWSGRRLLFVRQSYRKALSFPGGGVRHGEHPRDAAHRELAEELGIQVDEDGLMQVHQTTGIFDGRRDTVTFFEIHLSPAPLPRPDKREILHAEFIDFGDVAHLDVVGPVARYLEWRSRIS